MNQDEENKRFRDSALATYAIYGSAGIALAVSVVAGILFGNYLDKHIGTAPWLTIIGVMLGFAGGLLNLVRILGWFNKSRGSSLVARRSTSHESRVPPLNRRRAGTSHERRDTNANIDE